MNWRMTDLIDNMARWNHSGKKDKQKFFFKQESWTEQEACQSPPSFGKVPLLQAWCLGQGIHYIYNILGIFITEYVHCRILGTPVFSEVTCMNTK
jgi:hypothetical protein